MSIPLRVRSVSENLSLVFGLFFSKLGSLFLLSLFFAIPVLAPRVLAILEPEAWTWHDDNNQPWNLGEALSHVLWFLLAPVIVGAITGLMAGEYTGKKVSLFGSLGLGVRRSLSVLVYGLLYHLLLGLVLVPGIYLILDSLGSPLVLVGGLLAWLPAMLVLSLFFVGIPIVAVEKVGPFAAFARSLALTKGHRFAIFRFYFMLLVVSVILYMMSSLLVGMLGSLVLGLIFGPGLTALILLVLSLGLVGIGVFLLMSVLAPVVMYFQLRAAQGDDSQTAIAEFVDRIQARRTRGAERVTSLPE